MSERRGFGGWLGALSGRLQGRTRKGAADRPGEQPRPDLDESAAQRLDDALAGLRQRVPESDQGGSESSTNRS
jgi:hypothetical protein